MSRPKIENPKVAMVIYLSKTDIDLLNNYSKKYNVSASRKVSDLITNFVRKNIKESNNE